MGAWISDFKKSDAPQFSGKSDKERREMAIAAYLDAKKGPKTEAKDEPPFEPDKPQPQRKNSDGTPTSGKSQAKQAATKGLMKTMAQSKAQKLVSSVREAVHPDHVTLHPHKTDKTKYTVGQVGRNVKGRLNPGEHISDSEADDLHDMGMKVKHERKPYTESVEIDEATAYQSADHIKQPEHAKNFAGDEHYRHTGGEHSRKPANLSDKQAMDHHRASIEHDQAASQHDYMAERATSANARYHHRRAAETHRQASYSHDRAHYSDATHHDVHMAYHLGKIANDESQRVQSRVIKKKRTDESVEYVTEAKDMYRSAAQELKSYADKSGGMDKKDFHIAAKHIENIGRANIMNKGQHLAKFSQQLRRLDTSPREKILSVLHKHGHEVGNFMPGAVMKRRFSTEEVQENNSAPQTPAHRRAMMVGVDLRPKKVKLKGFGPDQAKSNMGNPAARAALNPTGKKPQDEAKSFDQKFRDHLKFSLSKSPAIRGYRKMKKGQKDAEHAKQDPKAVKLNYGPGVLVPGRAYNAATKRGMSPRDAAAAVSTTFGNRRKNGKLPK